MCVCERMILGNKAHCDDKMNKSSYDSFFFFFLFFFFF